MVVAVAQLCDCPSGHRTVHVKTVKISSYLGGGDLIPGQPNNNKVHKTPSGQKKLGMVAHTCIPSYCRNRKIGRTQSKKQRPWRKSKTPSPK
jgi:hypothetical protein